MTKRAKTASTRRRPSYGLWLICALGLAVVGRIIHADAAGVPAYRAAAEIVLALAAVALVALLAYWWTRGTAARLAQAVVVSAWAALVAAPVWINAHPADPLFDDTLGGQARERKAHPAATSGTHWLQVSVREGEWSGEYWLHATVGAERTTFRRTYTGETITETLSLNRGDEVTLLVELARGPLKVRLFRAPLDRKTTWILLLVAFFIAAGSEIFLARRSAGLAGVSTAIMAITCGFAALLNPLALPGAGETIAGLVGVGIAGGLAGGVWGVLARRWFRRR